MISRKLPTGIGDIVHPRWLERSNHDPDRLIVDFSVCLEFLRFTRNQIDLASGDSHGNDRAHDVRACRNRDDKVSRLRPRCHRISLFLQNQPRRGEAV
jgi:hypothetical protein